MIPLQEKKTVRVAVLVEGKPYRTFEGLDEEELLRSAHLVKSELATSGKSAEVKVFHQITG
jgi:hypothetical protein